MPKGCSYYANRDESHIIGTESFPAHNAMEAKHKRLPSKNSSVCAVSWPAACRLEQEEAYWWYCRIDLPTHGAARQAGISVYIVFFPPVPLSLRIHRVRVINSSATRMYPVGLRVFSLHGSPRRPSSRCALSLSPAERGGWLASGQRSLASLRPERLYLPCATAAMSARVAGGVGKSG